MGEFPPIEESINAGIAPLSPLVCTGTIEDGHWAVFTDGRDGSTIRVLASEHPLIRYLTTPDTAQLSPKVPEE